MNLDDLLSVIGRNDTQERGGRVLASVGGGLKALANLVTTVAGAPSADLAPLPTASPRLKGITADPLPGRLAVARSHFDASLKRLRSLRDERLADARNERESRAADDAAAGAAAARELTAKRIEQIDSRMANDARRTDAAVAASRAGAAGRRTARRGAGSGGNFTWVHPDSGKRYSVPRQAWDKSAHTLFSIVVDATRPAPDSRGYPSAEEWRRHCYDTYRGRDRRESFIMRHLPTSPAALDYLSKLTLQ